MRNLILSAALAAAAMPMWAADTVDAQAIIQKFAAKELEFSKARSDYTYRQTVRMNILDASGNPTDEKWEEVEDILFSPDGKRMEKVVYAPVPTLRQISLTPEDVQDLRNVQPFVLTTPEIPDYIVTFQGKEKIDEIGTYKFSIKPKKLVVGHRYFEGDIWVDDRDLQIVKTFGKGVGELKNGSSKHQAFPRFETYREQIDGKYWFPTYTHADDVLHFPDGQNVRIRMTVKYQDYKKYEGKSTIRYGDVVDEKSNQPNKP